MAFNNYLKIKITLIKKSFIIFINLNLNSRIRNKVKQ